MQPDIQGWCPSPPGCTQSCPPSCWSWGSQRWPCRRTLSTAAGRAGTPGDQSASSASTTNTDTQADIHILMISCVSNNWVLIISIIVVTVWCRGGVTHPLIDVCQPPPEGPCRQTAQRHIRAENGGAGAQRVRRCLRLLKATHPSLK